jgi:hypothetical protein
MQKAANEKKRPIMKPPPGRKENPLQKKKKSSRVRLESSNRQIKNLKKTISA